MEDMLVLCLILTLTILILESAALSMSDTSKMDLPERIVQMDINHLKINKKFCRKTCDDDSDCNKGNNGGYEQCIFWRTCPQKICMHDPDPYFSIYGTVHTCKACNPNYGPNMTNPDCDSKEECVFSPWCRQWACFRDHVKYPIHPTDKTTMTTTSTIKSTTNTPVESYCHNPVNRCCNSIYWYQNKPKESKARSYGSSQSQCCEGHGYCVTDPKCGKYFQVCSNVRPTMTTTEISTTEEPPTTTSSHCNDPWNDECCAGKRPKRQIEPGQNPILDQILRCVFCECVDDSHCGRQICKQSQPDYCRDWLNRHCCNKAKRKANATESSEASSPSARFAGGGGYRPCAGCDCIPDEICGHEICKRRSYS